MWTCQSIRFTQSDRRVLRNITELVIDQYQQLHYELFSFVSKSCESPACRFCNLIDLHDISPHHDISQHPKKCKTIPLVYVLNSLTINELEQIEVDKHI